VVSRQLSWDPDLRLFQQPLQRWLLGSGATAPSGFDRFLPLQNWPDTLAALAAAGLERLLLLGGAELATQLLAQGLVDELQLTLVPQLLGGPHAWLQSDGALEASAWTLLEQRCLGGDELLVRYRRS
jgi:5-amino-6-(5-phosphoribosylamino)uracil reductase